VRFIRSAASEIIGLFVSDWVQTVVIIAIVAVCWYAISGLRISPIPVLVGLVLLLAGQHVWFALAEARRSTKAA
jgi:hypothetical protein